MTEPLTHRSWLVVGIGWIVAACASTVLTSVGLALAGHHDLAWWPRFVARDLATWAFWAVMTPVILRLAHRFPIVGPNRWAPLGVHLVIGLFLATVFNGLRFIESVIIGWLTPRMVGGFVGWSLQQIVFEFFIYLSVVAVGSALDHERRNARLESHLLAAKLAALRAQLRPHFLFNTLHTAAMLIREHDNAEALRVVLDLSELLHRVVDDMDTDQIPLRRELSFLERYVGIERARFDDDLTMTIEADATALDAAVPPLLLQPLVENALRYGTSAVDGRTSVRVSARRQEDRVTIEVVDDGPGFDNERAARSAGVGLRNTRERLAALYPNDHHLEITALVTHGTRVRLTLPYVTAEVIQ